MQKSCRNHAEIMQKSCRNHAEIMQKSCRNQLRFLCACFINSDIDKILIKFAHNHAPFVFFVTFYCKINFVGVSQPRCRIY